jgi:hemolysin III
LSETTIKSSRVEISGGVVYLNRADEIANAITHGIGFLLSLVAMIFFWVITDGQPTGLRMACFVFTLSMSSVYLFSTLSHAVQEPRRRDHMRAWDQGTIYLLIAGTYSPFIWHGSPPGWTSAVFLTVWGAAAYGFFLKVLAAYRVNAVSTVTYVLLGWLPALVLFAGTPIICSIWMVVGGLVYTSGILFLLRSDQVQYSHAVWHVMVILGSTCHCVAIFLLLNIAQTSS